MYTHANSLILHLHTFTISYSYPHSKSYSIIHVSRENTHTQIHTRMFSASLLPAKRAELEGKDLRIRTGCFG